MYFLCVVLQGNKVGERVEGKKTKEKKKRMKPAGIIV